MKTRIPNLEVQTSMDKPQLKDGKNIKVITRFRPFNEAEIVTYTQQLENTTSICQIISETELAVSIDNIYDTYTFDRVFSPESSQEEIFELAGVPII